MNEEKHQLPYPPTDHTIFIANLPYNYNSFQLRRFVGKFCKPLFCRVPTSVKGTPKGCGFISLPSKEEENRVMRALKGKIIGRHPVDISHASLAKIERYFEEKEVKEAVRAAQDKIAKQKLYENDIDNKLIDAELNNSENKKDNESSDERGENDEDDIKGKKRRNHKRSRRSSKKARARARAHRRLLLEESNKNNTYGKTYDYESDYDYSSYYDYDYDKYRKDRRPPPPRIPPPIPPISPMSLASNPYDPASIAANTYGQMWSMMQNPALNQQMLLYNLMHAHYMQQYAIADQVKIAAAQLSQYQQAQQTKQDNQQMKSLDQNVARDLQASKDQPFESNQQYQPPKRDHNPDF